MWGLGTTSFFRWYSSDYRRSFQLNSPEDKMRTTGEQAFSIFTYKDQLRVNNLALSRLQLYAGVIISMWASCVLAWGWRGEVGAKPLFKIFQVPLTKGTEGLKVGQPGAFLWQETTKRYYTKVNKSGISLITWFDLAMRIFLNIHLIGMEYPKECLSTLRLLRFKQAVFIAALK